MLLPQDSAAGTKVAKDRLTLVVTCSAAGELRIDVIGKAHRPLSLRSLTDYPMKV